SFFLSPPDKYTALKTVLGFPFGSLIGIGLYFAVIDPIELPETTRQLLGAVMSLGLACGYAFSPQVRCITFLLLPTFVGRKGRSYIHAFVISYLIAGPIHNIIMNGREVARSLSCTRELSSNFSKARWELKKKPLGDVMQQFQSEGMYLNKVASKVNESFAPLKKEIRDHSGEKQIKKNTKFVDGVTKNRRGKRLKEIENKNSVQRNAKKSEKAEKDYRKKLELRCEDIWNQGVINCRKKFNGLWSRCLNTIPFIGYMLCLPLKMTFLCQLIRVVPGTVGMSCDAMDVVEPGFGDTYTSSEDAVESMDNSFSVNMQYKLVKSPEDIDYSTAEEVRKGTMHEFDSRELWLDFFMTLIKRFLAFTFILVFISSYKYNKKYLSDFRFDNIYITKYFRHIDARRHARGKSTLLPLKKFEAADLIFPSSKKIMKIEKKKLSSGTFMIVMRSLVATIIIWSANLIYNVLDIIRRSSRIEYKQQGKHHIQIDVHGTGFMGQIVRLFLSGFNSKHEMEMISTNFACLPQPLKLENKYILYVYLLYGLIWTFTLLEAYGLRLKRVVASFFYRKREKRRILYLYNEMLKKRRGFLRHVRHRILKQARKQQLFRKTGIIYSLTQRYPRLSFLKRFVSSKGKCLICEDPEKKDFVRCQTPGCNFGYCKECWIDIKRRCYACMTFIDEEITESDITDDDINDED
ncbi:hypothetical protein FSP39_012345, partial [Pinctada imbricata]